MIIGQLHLCSYSSCIWDYNVGDEPLCSFGICLVLGCMPDVKAFRKGIAGMASWVLSCVQDLYRKDTTTHKFYTQCWLRCYHRMEIQYLKLLKHQLERPITLSWWSTCEQSIRRSTCAHNQFPVLVITAMVKLLALIEISLGKKSQVKSVWTSFTLAKKRVSQGMAQIIL